MMTCLIISINRKSPVSEAEEIAKLAIAFYKKYPEVVVGIELSGDPMAGVFKNFVPALLQAREAGLKVSIFFFNYLWTCGSQVLLKDNS